MHLNFEFQIFGFFSFQLSCEECNFPASPGSFWGLIFNSCDGSTLTELEIDDQTRMFLQVLKNFMLLSLSPDWNFRLPSHDINLPSSSPVVYFRRMKR